MAPEISSFSAAPHVLIAGAGLGGLALAQCLRASSIPFTIFERDPSEDARSQGWSLALHTILPKLLAALPDDMPPIDVVDHLLPLQAPAQLCFYDTGVPELENMRFVAEDDTKLNSGLIKHSDTGGHSRIIRANRDRLRKWLATNIDVQWGKKVAGFTQDTNSVTVEFADGTNAVGDLLVGAEGVRSSVRELLLPDTKLENVPEVFAIGEVTLNKQQYERQMKIGRSAYIVHAEGWHLFVGLNKVADDTESADYYWDFIWHDQDRINEHHWTETASKEKMYEFVCEKTKDLDPRFSEIITLSGPSNMSVPPLVLRDMILEKMPVSRVTLLGDAAHPMTPFRGEGGCHALEDAISLADVLSRGLSLSEYQSEMLGRGSDAVKACRDAGNQKDGQRTEERKAWGQRVKMQPL